VLSCSFELAWTRTCDSWFLNRRGLDLLRSWALEL
jgi:hypothetical protein